MGPRNLLREALSLLKLASRIPVSPRTRSTRSSWLVDLPVSPRLERPSRPSSERPPTEVLTPTRPSPSVPPSREPSSLEMLRTSSSSMSLPFLSELRLWEESSPDSSTETRLFLPRNLRFSPPPPITRPRSESPFARDNKKLGDFDLTGIPMAPRGHPQIEVTFDIDANGIMNVSAKDKSTGKTQNVTIRSSGGLSDADIDRMVVEAEEAKSDDEAKKRIIDLKNEADQYVYNAEKQLTEHSARLPDSVKDQVRGDISSVNEAIVSEDADKIQEALEKLKNSSMEIGKAIYANTDG